MPFVIHLFPVIIPINHTSFPQITNVNVNILMVQRPLSNN